MKQGQNKYKSKIAYRVRIVNGSLLATVLLLVMGTLAFIVTNITSNASDELARLYSLKTVGKFSIYINRELVLMQILSRSSVIEDWFADEYNEAKKAAAFNEVFEHAKMLQNPIMYFGIHDSRNEYSFNNEKPFEDFTYYDTLFPDDPFNYWYYNCINADTDYTLNIDVDRSAGIRRMWINHKVMNGDEITGVISAGINFEDMAHNLFAGYDPRSVKGYIIDKNSVIKMDSSDSGLDIKEGANSINTLSADPLFESAMHSFREETAGFFFDEDIDPVLIKLNKGSFRYISLAPIAGSDWLVVIFFNDNSLFSVVILLPLIFTMLSAFLLYVMTERLLMLRIVITPLLSLKKSIPANETVTAEIYGQDRSDEIGDLARTIQKMREGLLNASQEHERLMRTDQLTNIPNRRYFDEHLPIEWERAARTKTPISMLMLDLDHFKKYNDNYGHLNGDLVLKEVAKIFTRELKRPTDFVVRWGGEEFVVILPDTDSQGALHIAEGIRKNIEINTIELSGGIKTNITVSIGANTIIPSQDSNPSDFIREADDALYKAKETGRNRVYLYTKD